MSARALVLAVVLVGCSGGNEHHLRTQPGPGEATPSDTTPPPAPTVAPSPTAADPVVLRVCQAFDEVVASGKPKDRLMQHTAVRAIELGVPEAELEALGARPAELAASLRKRGNPPECATFLRWLDGQGA